MATMGPAAVQGAQGSWPIGPVTWEEFISRGPMGASPNESFAEDRCEATREMECSWGSRNDFLTLLMGDQQVTNGGVISRLTPHAYPAFIDPESAQPFMWATGIARSVGFGAPYGSNLGILKQPGSDMATYLRCRYTVRYQSLPFDILTDQGMMENQSVFQGGPDEASLSRYVIKKIEPGAHSIQLHQGIMKFVGGQKPQGDPVLYGLRPPKIITRAAVTLTHKWVPFDAVGTKLVNPSVKNEAGNYVGGPIDQLLGRVNSQPFPATGPFANTFGPGTLFYVAVTIKPVRTPAGRRVYDVTHFFEYCAGGEFDTPPVLYGGHNLVPFLTAAGLLSWIEITSTGTTNLVTQEDGKNIYNWGDLNKLFRPPS